MQEQEQSLEKYLITCSQMFHGLTPKKVRCLAYETAVENTLETPENDVKISIQESTG